MQIAPGCTVAGRYRLESKLGAGAMGEVWAAKNVAVGTDVAVKILVGAAAQNAELVMRFRREAFLLARIRNDHVARVLDFGHDDVFGLVLVMELVSGEPLFAVLRKRRLTVDEAIDLGIDVLAGMLDLHRANIVHRDLKPGNVILTTQSTGRRKAVIVDFGLGKLIASEDDNQSGITRPDMAVGTLEYMAPEQILNSRSVTGAADIYALGAMLYRAVAGEHLFGSADNVALAQAKLTRPPPRLKTGRTDPVAAGLEAVVARAVCRRPEDRYPRAEDMLAELTALRESAQPTTPMAVPSPVADVLRAAEPQPRSPFAVLFALTVGIFLGAALGTGLTLHHLGSSGSAAAAPQSPSSETPAAPAPEVTAAPAPTAEPAPTTTP
jgi:serine/threonine-protein kinase